MSNTIFLIDDERETALQVYDRRGMDVVAKDIGIIKQLFIEFEPYVLESCFGKSVSVADGGEF